MARQVKNSAGLIFELKERLGGGYTAQVYEAEQIDNPRNRVAVKVLLEGIGERVSNEVHILNKLIPKFKGEKRPVPWASFGEIARWDEGSYPSEVIIMEYIGGENFVPLAEEIGIQRGEKDVLERSQIVLSSLRQYLDLIEVVHREGYLVAHDRKPGDFMWNRVEERLVVLDWNNVGTLTAESARWSDYQHAAHTWLQLLLGDRWYWEDDPIPPQWRDAPTVTLDPDMIRYYPYWERLAGICRGCRRALTFLHRAHSDDDVSAVRRIIEANLRQLQKETYYEYGFRTYGEQTADERLDAIDIELTRIELAPHPDPERALRLRAEAKSIWLGRTLTGDPRQDRVADFVVRGDYAQARIAVEHMLAKKDTPPLYRIIAKRYWYVIDAIHRQGLLVGDARRLLEFVGAEMEPTVRTATLWEYEPDGYEAHVLPSYLPEQVRLEHDMWQFLRTGQVDDALERYKQLSTEDPEYAAALRQISRYLDALLMEEERYNTVRQCFDEATSPRRVLDKLQREMDGWRAWYEFHEKRSVRRFAHYWGLRHNWRLVYGALIEDAARDNRDRWWELGCALAKKLIEQREELLYVLPSRWPYQLDEGDQLRQAKQSLDSFLGRHHLESAF